MALGEVCVAGLVVGWVVDRGDWLWLVSWDAVVKVDIGTWNLLGESVEDPTATTTDRPVAARAWKSPWLVSLFGRWEARSATEATVEPSASECRNQGAKIPDEQQASIGQRDGGCEAYPMGR